MQCVGMSNGHDTRERDKAKGVEPYSVRMSPQHNHSSHTHELCDV